VDIEQSVRERFNQHWSHNPHPSSHHNQIHISLKKRIHKGVIKTFSRLKLTMIEQLTRNVQTLRSLFSSTALVVDH